MNQICHESLPHHLMRGRRVSVECESVYRYNGDAVPKLRRDLRKRGSHTR